MAEGDTAALVVALSAQLTRFEKDMKAAGDIADKGTKRIESSFANVNKAILAQLATLSGGFSTRLGGLTPILTSFGKAGVIAATGIGAAAAAMVVATKIASRFTDQADQLEQSAENLGVTITQMKALGEAGEVANQSFEKTERAFITFIGGVENLRGAQGELYESLRKTNPELLLQLTNAKNSAEAIEILVRAFAKLETQTEKIALARAAGFTRGGVGTLEELAKGGNLGGIVAGMKNIDEATKALADFKKEIDKIKRDAFNLIGEFITTQGLEFLKTTVREFKAVGAVFTAIGDAIDRIRAANAPPTSTNMEFANVPGVPANVPLPQARPPIKLLPTAEQDLDAFKRAVSIMGDAVTLVDQYTLKQKELAVAVKNKEITTAQEAATLAAMNTAQKIAIATTLERLGIADREVIAWGKLAEIDAARAKGLITQAQATQAATLAMREANEEAKKLEERRALLPGLKQLQHDAEDLTKAFDKFAVSGLKSLEDGLVDVITGTKNLSEAFKAMVDSILKELIRLLLRKAVIGPIADLIGFGVGSVGTTPAAAGASFGGARAGGGPVKAGRFYRVGEQGSELFYPTVNGQIVPPMQSPPGIRNTGGGELNLIVENHGADVQTGEKKRNSSGGFDLKITVRSIVQEEFARGTMDSSMQRFGAQPRSVVR